MPSVMEDSVLDIEYYDCLSDEHHSCPSPTMKKLSFQGTLVVFNSSVMIKSPFFSRLSDADFEIDRNAHMFVKVFKFVNQQPCRRHEYLMEASTREKLVDELKFYEVLSNEDIDAYVGIAKQARQRDRVLQSLREKKRTPTYWGGFIKVFDTTLCRGDIRPCEIHTILEILVTQADLYVRKWECQVRHDREQKAKEDDSDYDDEGYAFYQEYAWDYVPKYERYCGARESWRHVAIEDCKAWFKNPNYANPENIKRFDMPPVMVTWSTLNMAPLLASKVTLVAAVKKQFGETWTRGIDELFNGKACYSCFVWNDVGDTIRLMHSVLYHVDRLMKDYVIKPQKRFRRKILKYMGEPYYAHLDSIHDEEYDDGPVSDTYDDGSDLDV